MMRVIEPERFFDVSRGGVVQTEARVNLSEVVERRHKFVERRDLEVLREHTGGRIDRTVARPIEATDESNHDGLG